MNEVVKTSEGKVMDDVSAKKIIVMFLLDSLAAQTSKSEVKNDLILHDKL